MLLIRVNAFSLFPGWALAEQIQRCVHDKIFLIPTKEVFGCFCPLGSHRDGMLPHRQAIRPGNMLTVNQEIPEELVEADEAVLCPLLAGQMSVSKT